MVRSKWFAVDVKNDVAELSIFDEIGGFGVYVSEFKEAFDLVKNQQEIKLLLNSPGGSITEGMALYNLLASVRPKLVIETIGIAASIASVVALAGREHRMGEGTYYMIHNPWTVTWGDAEQLRKDAEVLDKMRGEIINIYAAHSSLSAEAIGQMMDAETWLTADEAHGHGFAQVVLRETKAAARAGFDLGKIGFQHVPRALVERPDWKNIQTVRDFERFLRDAGASRTEAERIASSGFGHGRGDPGQAPKGIAEITAAITAAANVLK